MISVIVPAFNASTTIGACVEALLKQTFSKEGYEVIVVDDASLDQTAAIAAGYGARVISQKHRGPAAARNLGASEARGEILLFIDADCAPSGDWIAQMVAPFKSAEIVAVKGVYEAPKGGILPNFIQAEFEDRYRKLAKKKYIDFVDTYSAGYRRTVFLENGGFDESFPVPSAEDVDFSFRLAQKGYKMAFAPNATVAHLQVPSLWSYLKKKYRYGYYRTRVYRKYPNKAVKDSYTPRTVPLQILLSAVFAVSLGVSSVASQFLPVSILLLLGLLLTALPFAIRVSKRGRVVALVSPGLIILRSLAQCLGLLVGGTSLLFSKGKTVLQAERLRDQT